MNSGVCDFYQVFVQVVVALDAQAVCPLVRKPQIEKGLERFPVIAVRAGLDQRFTIRIDNADPVMPRFTALT